MMSYTCAACVNYNGDNTCKAFPKGIPEVIAKGKNPHTKPLPTQKNKIVFEPKN